MYATQYSTAEIKLKDYISQYRDADRFITYCKQCGRYDSCWSCPPFDFNTDKYMLPYKTAYIIGTRIIPDKITIEQNRGFDKCTAATYRMIAEVRSRLDARLLMLEDRYPGSKAFFAGTCHICPAGQCTRIRGEACIAPEKIRPSLESFGFDIGKTTSRLLGIEMKWSNGDILPGYFTLVSGFFTTKEIPAILTEITKET